MRAKTVRRFLLTAGLGTILTVPLISCDGDGVGLDKNGDLLVAKKPTPLRANKDNTLYEDPTGSLSNGAGDYFFAGQNAIGTIRRGLLAFDIAGTIPAGATVTGATLMLQMSRTPGGTESVTLHRVTEDWGESSSVANRGEGEGIAAATGDATWLHTMFNTDLWSTPGGSFFPTASASQAVNAIGTYTWSGAQMVADIQSWLDNPTANFGWILLGNESVSASAKRFNSRENTESPPRLLIEFTF